MICSVAVQSPFADLSHFQPFSLVHLIAVTLYAAITAAICVLGRRWRGQPRGRELDRFLAIFCVLVWIPVQIHGFLPSQYDISQALPIQICDIGGLIAPLVLAKPTRWLRAILYYWGIGLSTQAFIQPDLRGGPADLAFWVFGFGHAVVVTPAIYDVAARGFRPGWKDYGIGLGSLAVLAAFLLPLDIATGWNYGYIGNSTPGQKSIFDVLGPWPLRLLPLTALVAGGLALFTTPWVILKARQKTADAALDQTETRGLL